MLTVAILAAFLALVWALGSYVAAKSADPELSAASAWELERRRHQQHIEDHEERMP